MKKLLKITGIVLGIVLVVAVGLFVWVWKNPVAAYEWTTRKALDSRLERSSLRLGSGRLVYWEGGAGQELLLLHGAGDQAGTWSQVVPALTGSYRVVVLDLPGHGDSDPQDGPLPMSVIVDGVAEFLARRDSAAPMILVGNSLGAWVSMVLAERFPERIARVVAVNGGPLRHEPEGLRLIPGNREEARELMRAIRDPSAPPLPAAVLDDIVERFGRGAAARLVAARADMERYHMDGRLGSLETPVDIVWGESDRMFPPEYARRMNDELPRSRLTLIPTCGHMPATECPERFTEKLQEVLELSPPPPAPGS